MYSTVPVSNANPFVAPENFIVAPVLSKVVADNEGNIKLDTQNQAAGNSVSLRFEMDTLVLLHTCPHPLSQEKIYPLKPVQIELGEADPVSDDDYCKNFRLENQRGFHNNALYYLAAK